MRIGQIKALYFSLALALLFGQQIQSKEVVNKPGRLLILGDSITEGYGVAKENSYPTLLEAKIKNWKSSLNQAAKGFSTWQVINSGVSGSTTASAASRLKWVMKDKPDIIVLALGANDGLRGLPIGETKKNLSQAIELIQKENVKVVIAGMQMPPNYGKSFTQEFRDIFPQLSKKYKIKLIPFLLDQVAGVSDLNQADGIHPNEKGHQIIAETVFRVIKDML